MLVLEFYFYIRKGSETVKIYYFSLENWAWPFTPALLFLSLNNIKETLYINLPEIISFNLKISIQNILHLTVSITFFVLMFHIFTGISLVEIKNFEVLLKIYQRLLIIKLSCFKVLYNMFKYQK